ncbi:glycosyltransferase [Candidatus Nitrosoglobus terrae]|uniref:glycosyltransferase n=1 Tax=Candidatus Nitrosoglobus terrae TaxID=1630141 RepID=UPI001E3351E0|nr:glycosyltransferase [Candidatus Nitrosoglobus terrae]
MNAQTIDIIIPIYNAYEHLIACLASVDQHTERKYQLILIDDASTDLRIESLFETLKEKNNPNILLLKNKLNQGFVATANRGMKVSKNDVVLLNSDTLVTQNWLGKLKRCADSDPKIGTITPFSNNAEICSFPEFCRENPMPEDLALINRAIEAASVPIDLDIPTGVGFCLYIRRSLINKIGVFDVETFGKGYGEENDFCLRARQVGYRNVLCSNAYVAHVGSGSFGQEKKELAEKQMAALLKKHPSYLTQVARFIAQDPIRPIRHMIQTHLQIVSNPQKLGILHILHGHGGGTEKYARNIAELMAGQFRHYLLIALEREWIVKVIDPSCYQEQSYHFPYRADELWVVFLESICAWLDIRLCHIHQLSGCRDGLLSAFSQTHIPYGFSIHDFFLACPSVNFLDGNGHYCGGVTEVTQCQKCLDEQVSFAGMRIKQWRLQHKVFLAKAAFIFAPSLWAKNTFSQYFPEIKVEEMPNVHSLESKKSLTGGIQCFLLPQDGVKHIGVMGAIGPVKGARNLEQLVTKTRDRKLPIRWVVIGYTDRQYKPYQSKDYVLTVHGPYAQENLASLLDHYHICLVVFPSIGPETFSYTLSEAWAAGKPVLVPPIGALKERVEQTGVGWLMEDWTNVDKILDQIVDLTYQMDQKSPITEMKKHKYNNNEQVALNKIESLYSQFLALAPIPLQKRISPLRVYEGACYGTGVDNIKNKLPRIKKVIGAMIRYGLRFRYTVFGTWIERKLPASWHYRLRRLLLQG